MIAFNTIHAEITWTLSDDGTLTISGTDMPDYGYGDAPWYSQRDKIMNVVIENGVKNIGAFAFRDCSSLVSVNIPESVTSININAFCYCTSLTYIDIPNSVTFIGENAFSCCSSMFSVCIPNSVTSIEHEAFPSCSALETIIVDNDNPKYDSRNNCNAVIETETNTMIAGCKNSIIPNSVTSIGLCAFYGCSGLTDISIPESVINIGQMAFRLCTALTSVSIPNSVVNIESEAFYGCSSLTSVNIPSSVANIEGNVFSYCPALESIIVENDNPNYDSRNNCNAVIETETNSLIAGCNKTIVPSTVTSIGSSAFWGSSLTSVNIPNSVTDIGTLAFSSCYSLSSIYIPNSVTNIEASAFFDCSHLGSITVENGNPKYDSRNNCNAIIETESNTLIRGCENTIIPSSITSIGDYAFYYCYGLTSITIPNSVTSIGSSAFSGTKWYNNQPDGLIYAGLVIYGYKGVMPANTKIDIKEGTKGIAGEAFMYCSSLSSVNIPNSVTNIGMNAFYGCSSLTSVNIPSSVASIREGTFHGCSSLTSISIPNSVTSIGAEAFSGCSSLTFVDLPNSVTSIETRTFDGCTSLTSFSIPYSVTNIGIQTFERCSSLSSLICNALIPPTVGSWVFHNTQYQSGTLYVPASAISAYKNADGWKDWKNILPIPNEYTLTDGESYNIGSQLDGYNISYLRTFSNTNWQALYIPFSLSYDDWKDDFDVAYINGIRQLDKDDNGTIDETIMDIIKIKSGSTAPNTPYLIRAKIIGEKTLSASNAILYAAEEKSIDCRTTIVEYTFTGTYSTIPSATMIANNYYAMGGGELIHSDGSNDLKPYRWYMKAESRNSSYNANNAAKTITINVIGDEEATTGVRQLQMTNGEFAVYDLNGRKVNENKLKPGIYIKNGKKFVVK